MTSKYRYKLRVKAHFEAAHRLDWHEKCHVLHGHTYHVEVAIAGNQLNENGVIMDLTEIKHLLNDILPDHQCLSDIVDPRDGGSRVIVPGWIENPTVERIAEYLLTVLQNRLVELGHLRSHAHVAEVTVWESPTGGVTVYG